MHACCTHKVPGNLVCIFVFGDIILGREECFVLGCEADIRTTGQDPKEGIFLEYGLSNFGQFDGDDRIEVRLNKVV